MQKLNSTIQIWPVGPVINQAKPSQAKTSSSIPHIQQHLATRPKLAVKRIGPSVLASGEPVHASVGAVVHPVVDRVDAAAGASVLADGAAGRRGALRRGVVDLVAGAGAAALEDVVEAEPVADFVGGGRALVVRRRGAAGERVGQVDAAVEGEVRGGRAGGWEVAPAGRG